MKRCVMKFFKTTKFISLFLVFFLAVGLLFNMWQNKHNMPELMAKSEDKAIVLTWKLPAEKALLYINDKKTTYTEPVEGQGRYVFTNGEHGSVYTIRLEYRTKSSEVKARQVRRMFLDFDKMPDLTTVYLETEDGQMPYYERAFKPVDAWGQTIVKNEYKKGTFNNIPVKIRVRGNTSALAPKKPYKLHFEKKTDLLGLGKEYADKEWYLLASGGNLKTYFGLKLGQFVGMEWEPRMRFVNLMFNGEYMGLYVLTESIKRHPKRCAIEKTGYWIESDNYWWKPGEVYFKSGIINVAMGFTFKYPKITSKFDERISDVKKQMEMIEQRINKETSKIQDKSVTLTDLIDMDSWASWLLAQELMGNWDVAGSNIFFYKQDNKQTSKWKMGPLWDFDRIFIVKDNEHTDFYSRNTTYFPLLWFFNKNFKTAYAKKYFSVVGSIEEKMRSALEDVKKIDGLEESRILDSKLWRYPYISIDSEIDNMMKHLHARIEWLNEQNEIH